MSPTSSGPSDARVAWDARKSARILKGFPPEVTFVPPAVALFPPEVPFVPPAVMIGAPKLLICHPIHDGES